ncbi:hypothetical protein [Sphaerisporangium sp. TRM90804]|uniref:hypothetical protein n=1 Tax=Sphaerisporangium sp. TRM90804 TaxID=3031113 RepID=UPI00244B28A0|nr:hypothetical protein [Sphaerisporangium sp. TRM90804]MDH2425814.1 hypothetical protein [Sphaerisporangium sp. TRM90804]
MPRAPHDEMLQGQAAERIAEQVQIQIAALARTYPAWKVARMRHGNGTYGGWLAVRRGRLTTAERGAGMQPFVRCADAIDLVMQLAVQEEIARQVHEAGSSGASP